MSPTPSEHDVEFVFSPSSSLSPPPRGRASVSHNFRYPTLQSSTTQGVLQSIVKGRKSWKTSRGGEIVWPPELEAALLEGLENYQPDDSRETRLLGRFPMRNRFISDYIYKKTGQKRTAKQVGSRLQQLRDSCGGKRLLNLLSPFRRQRNTSNRSHDVDSSTGGRYGVPSLRYTPESSDASSSSSPNTPTSTSTVLPFSSPYPGYDSASPTVVHIDILPQGAPGPSGEIDPTGVFTHNGSEVGSTSSAPYVVRSSRSRHIYNIDPTITFLSRSSISATSHYTVYHQGTDIFTEDTPLTLLNSYPDDADGALLYTTNLIPKFWRTLVESSDPTQYTIAQQVIQDSPESSTSPSLMFSATYKFNCPLNTRVHSEDTSYSHVGPSADCLPNSYPAIVDSDSHDTLFNFMSHDSTPDWDFSSPSLASTDILLPSCDKQRSVEQDDHLLSPSTCFPPDLSNYVL